ncbi:thioredoxin family protein [Massilia endophytica]|uniref:thioredoxin family protein n=1 Tax=Massilia endophytica TaxID=2899220 RepID=UPI001E5EEAC1|nr:thioredoxin family protein [Massilia endophytica]UGQ48057.1 thioredoxin family protein [Massilia endophytica]
MHSTTLQADNRAEVAAALAQDRLIVACLCAAWCGTCSSYRATFEELAMKHPEKYFLWVDIEDHADVVGDLDVENFPTLLIQRHETVAFFGTMVPDPNVANRLIETLAAESEAELAKLAQSTAERRQWQSDCNLRTLLA